MVNRHGSNRLRPVGIKSEGSADQQPEAWRVVLHGVSSCELFDAGQMPSFQKMASVSSHELRPNSSSSVHNRIACTFESSDLLDGGKTHKKGCRPSKKSRLL